MTSAFVARIGFLAALLTVGEVFSCQTLVAATAAKDKSLEVAIIKLIIDASGLPSDPSLPVVGLPTTLLIPNLADKNSDFLSSMTQFDQIPSSDGVVDPSADSIKDLLKEASAHIQIGTVKLTSADQQALAEAYARLYVDSGHTTPTDLYRSYLAIKHQIDSLSDQLSKSTDANERTSLAGQISSLGDDLLVSGGQNEIEPALATLGSLGPRPSGSLKLDWASSIERGASLDSHALTRFLSTSGWLRVDSVGGTAISSAALYSPRDGKAVPLPRLSRIAFQFSRFVISRPALDHPFLADDSWRLDNGSTISKHTDGPGQLIPRFFSELILIKDLEVTLSSDLTDDAVLFLADQQRLELSGVTIRSNAHTELAYQSRYISTSSPIVVAAIISQLPLIPNPAANIKWSN